VSLSARDLQHLFMELTSSSHIMFQLMTALSEPLFLLS
jgi:hypothetical protein